MIGYVLLRLIDDSMAMSESIAFFSCFAQSVSYYEASQASEAIVRDGVVLWSLLCTEIKRCNHHNSKVAATLYTWEWLHSMVKCNIYSKETWIRLGQNTNTNWGVPVKENPKAASIAIWSSGCSKSAPSLTSQHHHFHWSFPKWVDIHFLYIILYNNI